MGTLLAAMYDHGLCRRRWPLTDDILPSDLSNGASNPQKVGTMVGRTNTIATTVVFIRDFRTEDTERRSRAPYATTVGKEHATVAIAALSPLKALRREVVDPPVAARRASND
jgi:hypothetical protein